ncbi:DUF4258 domain-containing protein [Capnocytophaga stomatis]|uniref:DUF4258 domain-containing protein n=1 Tax=Capnocytophaga stomatis TaxID=1848904 RepID=UPI001AC14793|nr:DUF4258 domain-containing protein [Capnocytophaga stomatis]GIM49639.1 hypothetical protein CAPN003_10910 [Capnocytophaga stomatis]
MSILKRIGYYSIGLSIGIVIVAFFFKKKETEAFCYFPNCRVLKDLRSKTIEISPEIIATKEELTKVFTDGNVLFAKSDVKAVPCKIYVIEGDLQGKKVEITVENCKEKVIVKKVETQ